LLRRTVVDEEGFERLEEETGETAAARCRPAGFAHRAAQFLQDKFRTGRLVAAQQAAFELGDQEVARFRLQVLKKYAQAFDQPRLDHPANPFPAPHPNAAHSAAALRTG
jgi:hypothetical protein